MTSPPTVDADITPHACPTCGTGYSSASGAESCSDVDAAYRRLGQLSRELARTVAPSVELRRELEEARTHAIRMQAVLTQVVAAAVRRRRRKIVPRRPDAGGST